MQMAKWAYPIFAISGKLIYNLVVLRRGRKCKSAIALRCATFSLLGIIPFFVACSTLPSGPSVMVLPGTGKTFDQFRADNFLCRQFAFEQSGGVEPGQVSGLSEVGSAIAGTALGAAAGAAFGGGRGAAIGAGSGLLAGSIVGAEAAAASGEEAQQRYDMSYIQCMYAKGHRVPIVGDFIDAYPQQETTVPPANIPPAVPGPPRPPLYR